jgi:glycine oxidase
MMALLELSRLDLPEKDFLLTPQRRLTQGLSSNRTKTEHRCGDPANAGVDDSKQASQNSRFSYRVSGDLALLFPRGGRLRPHGRLLAFFVHLHQISGMAKIHVLGAGIVGLWQAFMLRMRGHEVVLWDPAGIPSSAAASRLAGAMLAPFCEGEPGHEVASDLGVASLSLWKQHYPGAIFAGTLVVAHPRDRADFQRFARVTDNYRHLQSQELADLEPALGGRFREALFYPDEGHVEPSAAMGFLAKQAVSLGVEPRSAAYGEQAADWIVDCRGIAAADSLATLRGVRGERILIECADVTLRRPIRLLHPRIPFYMVPWPGQRFMIGATVIESDDVGSPTLRSAAELLSAAYSLSPSLGEAKIVEIAAGVRPSFPDNTPKIIVRGRRIFVNGLYRHGFLVSPILAQAAADYIENGSMRTGVVFEDHGEW